MAAAPALRTLGELRASLGDLRRYEKDMIINYEKPEIVVKYRDKWRETKVRTLKLIDAMLEGEEDVDNPILRKLYLAYLWVQGGFWGFLLHGRPRVYTYIPDSLRGFVSADEFCSVLRHTGYREVAMRRFIFGGIALHWAARDR